MSKRLENLLRHINGVRENCELLGHKLILIGKEELGIQLIGNGQIHDHSKFYGIEWEYLNDGTWPYSDSDPIKTEMFNQARMQHAKCNKHHPEAWIGGIQEMDDLHIAEMVCDWYARSKEQGSCLMDWIRDKATDKFDFTTKERVYRDIRANVEMLLEKRF